MALYSDINLKNSSEKTLVLDIEDIFQSIETIIFTPPRTRMFNRKFGTNINILLFEPMDRITALKIFDNTLSKIERYEPRVKIYQNISSVTCDFLNKTYHVVLGGVVPGLDNRKFEYRGQLKQQNPLLNNFITGAV